MTKYIVRAARLNVLEEDLQEKKRARYSRYRQGEVVDLDADSEETKRFLELGAIREYVESDGEAPSVEAQPSPQDPQDSKRPGEDDDEDDEDEEEEPPAPPTPGFVS